MVETEIFLNIARLFVGVVILGYASYTDIKTRRASNMLWVIMGGIGGVILVIHFFTTDAFEGDYVYYLVFIPVMIVLVYILFQLRLIFGGADAKALMALAILLPLPTLSWIPESTGLADLPLGSTTLPYCWGVFINALLLFLFLPIGLLIFNLMKRQVRFPHAFLGYKMTIDKARERFVWPLEKFVEGKSKFVYMPKDFDIEEELKKFEENKIKEIWVTPKIPFMIPLLCGFISVYIFGDFLTHIMNFFQSLFI